MEKKFSMQEHDADIKYKISGKSLSEIFENSAAAFSSYIASQGKISSKKKKTIELKADNKESLLYLFLDELIYLLDAEDFAPVSAKVKIKDNSLKAVITGDSVKKYNLNHVKAATYAEMYIKNKGKSWEAQIVLDV